MARRPLKCLKSLVNCSSCFIKQSRLLVRIKRMRSDMAATERGFLEHQPRVKHTVSAPKFSKGAGHQSITVTVALPEWSVWAERISHVDQKLGSSLPSAP